MSVDWQDLGAAFALYLVLEGALPFLSPAGAQRVFLAMSQASAAQLRMVGLVSMLAGCGLLYYLRG
jgi:uncharacterized protein YjeT (DUF2065 family)